MPNIDKLDEIIRLALEEDIGSGDVTTLATVGKTRNISGKFIAAGRYRMRPAGNRAHI